jgi:hypothetical protein
MLIRLEALELAANAGEPDESDRYHLNVVQVRANGSVIVTDGSACLRIQAAVDEPGLFDALMPAQERGFEGEVLIEKGDAIDFKAACRKALKRAGKKSSADGGEPVHVVIAKDGDTLKMATADGIVERQFLIKQPDGLRFPDVDRVIPAGEHREIILSVELLLKMLRTLKRLRVRAVTLGLSRAPLSPIRITANSHAGAIDGALMPMLGAEKPEPKEPVQVDVTTGEITDGQVLQ